eukprot:874060-Rhodomonas_salina.1
MRADLCPCWSARVMSVGPHGWPPMRGVRMQQQERERSRCEGSECSNKSVKGRKEFSQIQTRERVDALGVHQQ